MNEYEKEMFEKIVKSMEDSDKRMNECMNSEKSSCFTLVSLKENIDEAK